MESPSNQGLESAFKAVQQIQKEMQRTNTLSLADVVAFGGAEALETAGCGRLIVQVGRVDNKTGNDAPVIPWGEGISSASADKAFSTSGLGADEIALLLGALGELRRVVAETKLASTASNKNEDEDEDDQPFEAEPFVPTTFGARDAIYGAKMVKGDFGNKYLQMLVKGKTGQDDLKSALMDDQKIKAAVMKYASNEAAFLKNLPDAYLKLTKLGEAYITRNS